MLPGHMTPRILVLLLPEVGGHLDLVPDLQQMKMIGRRDSSAMGGRSVGNANLVGVNGFI